MITRKYERLTAKQIATILRMKAEGFDNRTICERFGITREWLYHIFHQAKEKAA